MLKLDLKETGVSAGLLLAAVVADQTAANLDVGFCVCGLNDKLVGKLPEATFVLRQVYITHLSRRLGQGFTVSDDDQGLVTVALDMAEEAESEPGNASVSGDAPRRRGRPPGSKTRPPAEP